MIHEDSSADIAVEVVAETVDLITGGGLFLINKATQDVFFNILR